MLRYRGRQYTIRFDVSWYRLFKNGQGVSRYDMVVSSFVPNIHLEIYSIFVVRTDRSDHRYPASTVRLVRVGGLMHA